jgi:hypothetical protein
MSTVLDLSGGDTLDYQESTNSFIYNPYLIHLLLDSGEVITL